VNAYPRDEDGRRDQFPVRSSFSKEFFVTSIAASLLSADRRMEILKGLPIKQIQVICTGDVLDTLFFSDDDMPFSNPQASIEGALSAYWMLLRCASRIFTAGEWGVLSGRHSPLTDGRFSNSSAASAAASIAFDYAGDEWNVEILEFKALLPKIAALSDTDFAAVNVILGYLRGLSCDDRISAMSLKLPALKSDRQNRAL
jgi:hypothetical protein